MSFSLLVFFPLSVLIFTTLVYTELKIIQIHISNLVQSGTATYDQYISAGFIGSIMSFN